MSDSFELRLRKAEQQKKKAVTIQPGDRIRIIECALFQHYCILEKNEVNPFVEEIEKYRQKFGTEPVNNILAEHAAHVKKYKKEQKHELALQKYNENHKAK